MKIENPLVPFIVFFALVILLTIVVTNSRSSHQQDVQEPKVERTGLTLSQVKNPILDQQPRTEIKKEAPQETPDIKKLLASAINDSDSGDTKSAEDKLRTLIVFDPGNVKAISLLGSIMFQQGNYQEAEFFFRMQAKVAPDDVSALNNLASALSRQCKYPEAIQSIEKVLEINPDSGAALLTLSGLNSLAGNTQEALENFKSAYAKMGERILPLSNDPNLNNIRDNPEFKDILDKINIEKANPEKAMRDPANVEQPAPEPQERP